MRKILFLAVLLFCEPCFSQTAYSGAVNSMGQTRSMPVYQKQKSETRFKDSEQAENLERNIRDMRGKIGYSQNTQQARNLLLLKEVLDYKLKDETLSAEVSRLQQNREFNKQLLQALKKLDNKKNRNSKDQEIINILNDSGNRIYNSLLN